MSTATDKIRQLAPHWAVMFVIMLGLIVAVESVYGPLALWQSLILVILVAVAYPPVVRQLGFAPEIWQQR